ncbi:acyl-CoA/acyl-ACP dehydrogenase [Streptomyces sp. ET3-23]|uniref:acyl-CoA dehydrogenase family protein n=1 Tax=Streptomyces sp. ET3-23 TaxID=2885643 RepID=UPI001D127769|nr:acyl-CoA dehydrogenase family protein [Streptomyces sp. ET3-23]MCC2278309.1 acyl-CoA/acyl-ACP dehydrogenase [Streptomyces sp. ET3-23]
MDARLTHEQQQMRSTLRELLQKHASSEQVRAAVRTPAGYDAGLWRLLGSSPGLAGLAVEQRYGGAGCGTLELALAAAEAGRALLPSPLLSTTVLTVPLVTALGTPQQRAQLLPRLASGELTGALVLPGATLTTALGLAGPVDDTWSGGGRAGGIQARRTADGWRLYGEAGQVLDGHSAGLLLVAAHTGGYARSRTCLFVVRPDSAHAVTRTRLTALDETRPQARIELRDTEAELLGTGEASTALAVLGGSAAPVLAAEASGAAERALEKTVEYARVREQFGRPIGSFQAVKHRLADLHVTVQAARSAVYYAAWAAAGTARGRAVGALALAQALETQWRVAGEAVQLHGGIGVTWEHDVQLYFKRAASDELLFGPVHRLRAHAAELAGLFDVSEAREAVVL